MTSSDLRRGRSEGLTLQAAAATFDTAMGGPNGSELRTLIIDGVAADTYLMSLTRDSFELQSSVGIGKRVLT